MPRTLTACLAAAACLAFFGCATPPQGHSALIIGIGFVRIPPPAPGSRFELLGVAAVVHPAFTGIAAGAVAHQAVAVELPP